MKYAYTDYLFLLAIYTDYIPLDNLLALLAPGEAIDEATRENARKSLLSLEAIDLVQIEGPDDGLRVRITPLGRTIAEAAADIMAGNHVRSWQSEQADLALYAAV